MYNEVSIPLTFEYQLAFEALCWQTSTQLSHHERARK